MSDPAQRVAVLAPIGRDGPACCQLLARVGVNAFVCADVDALVRALKEGIGAALVAEEAVFAKPIEPLVSYVEGQPTWSDLPFVMLSSHHEDPGVMRWREQIIAKLRNVSLLERPIQVVTLTSAMKSALRARQRQYEVRDHLLAREQAAENLERLVSARTAQLQKANDALLAQMAERERVESRLRQVQKMEAIGHLSGGIAHDFNNMLSVVSGGLSLLKRRLARGDKNVMKYVEAALEGTARAAALTQRLLAFSRQQPLSPRPINVNSLIQSMSDLLRRTLRDNVIIRTDLAAELWITHADANQLENALLNLVVNARDAMPQGGELVVSTLNVRQHQAAMPGDYVRITVTDTGCGMSPDVSAQAFDPFFTTKGPGKGTGLGLSQVYGFVHQSGGHVEIDSVLNQGTSVRIYLPRFEGALVEAVSGREGPLAESHHETVLVVEDEERVRELTVAALEELGYRVLQAGGAAVALRHLDADPTIDLLFTDIVMPDVNGRKLAEEAKRRRPDLKVLYTTGFMGDTLQDGNSAAGEILQKPFTLDQLAAKVSHILAGGQ